ncbi:TPA: HNH endonuclease [Streptococcus suis 2651]|uniref:HNH endonuclease n=1 Tax=Streptococcus suis TaxID=1307 RepID=UPI0003FB90C9|nr:HNH endonuclease [Streptococcus suis]HEL1668992.1 HNH endonuclease [Streptococcus suis]HEL1754256.1 HNH endonuclease [Streptococcus suis]HEM3220549.1 HNH endonuclease [Streptococcus suis 2651]HEM4366671.1 HNH endonuclease [Streptococcus suis]
MIKFLFWLIVIALVISMFPIFITIAGVYALYRLVRYIRKERYFKSDEFLDHKRAISSTIQEYNELADYVDSFEEVSLQSINNERFKYAHLTTYENTSTYNMNRERNVKNLSSNTYQTSLQVVRKASEEPMKYLCKYFNVKPTEENLNHIQEMGETISRFANAEENLNNRLIKIEEDFNPPKFIKKHYINELRKHLEINVPEIHFHNPNYIFEYVSPGGNSSQRTTITLDEQTIEGLAEYLSERIKYGKSAKVQRSLMTKKLREFIKKRDNYTCQNCFISTAEQSLLLLEVDHILPVSKGGLSTEDNLQTLCWKCNRSKSNKIA